MALLIETAILVVMSILTIIEIYGRTHNNDTTDSDCSIYGKRTP